uniref:Nuclear pore complex protein Nup153 n=1 Tax=Plectus sambesii TaxID=2011161 RepID=A0A914UTG8_9BILA
LRGPPLASLSTPTRAQLLSRTIGSNSSKPYWRRPSMSAARAAPSAVKTSPTSAGGIVKGADGTKINKFSARIPELEEPDSTPHFNSVPLPIATSQVPAAGFLAGSSKFSFAKPVPKSGPVVSPAETPGVSSVMAVKNKWTCSACFVGNDADAEQCACCSGPRAAAPKSEASSTSAPIAAANFSTSSSDTNSIDLPKKAWNCSTCFVSNDGSADQCVACSESRPGAPKSEKSKTLFPGSIFQSSSSSSSASPFADSAAAAPKKGWSCSNCFVKNEDSTDNCVACMGARPGAPKVDGPKALFANSLSSTSAPSTENKTTSAKKGWTCSTCFVGNDDSTDQCVACSESRPGAPKSDKNKPLFAGSIFSTSSSAAGSEASIPKKDWSCTTCFVSNKADKLSCDACQSPKPGSTFKPVSFGFGVASKPAAAVIPSGVSFGVAPHNESFGEKKTVKFAEPLTTTTTFSSAQSPLS